MSRSFYGVRPRVKRHKDWSKVAKEAIRLHPYCAACGKKTCLVPHHIWPVHVYPHLELEIGNLLILCESPTLNCHLWCGHLGYWPSWNVEAVGDAAKFRAKVLARPSNVRVPKKMVGRYAAP